MRKTKLKSKSSGLKTTSSLKARSSLKKSRKKMSSKKNDAWKRLRSIIYEELSLQGITSCELKIPNMCLGSFALGLAHSKKRMYIKTEADMREVVLACVACHEVIENMPKAMMEEIVKKTILMRG